MPFEKHEKRSGIGESSTEPMISIRKSGSIGINQDALDEHFEEDVEYIEMYYDEDENQLGLRGLDEETEDSYTLSTAESGGSVTAQSFMNKYELNVDVTTQFAPEKQSLNGDVELVTIDLDEPIGTYGSPDNE